MSHKLFSTLGFQWDRQSISSEEAQPLRSVSNQHLSYQEWNNKWMEMLPYLVLEATHIEDEKVSFGHVLDVIHKESTGGLTIAQQSRISDISKGINLMFYLVNFGMFSFSRPVFSLLHRTATERMAIRTRGMGGYADVASVDNLEKINQILSLKNEECLFRDENEKGESTIFPGKDKTLSQSFSEGIAVLGECHPLERAIAFFLFAAKERFFFAGNKRTARLMMNGILNSNGMNMISIPTVEIDEFRRKLSGFYITKDANEVMAHLVQVQRRNLIEEFFTVF